MCGITGIYSAKHGHNRQALARLATEITDTLSHRGPDSSGIWQDPDKPLALGHRRLAIIDLSENGHQPMESASGRYVITYNGEFYRFSEIKSELGRMGVSFRGRSDTEVILAAIDYWGLNLALQKIDGMFAFALWDKKEKRLHLVRDRLGKKPLYVGWAGQALVFASELKAIHTHPDFKPAVNRRALSAYMRFGYVPAPLCIYENVWSLPAGFRVSINVDQTAPGSDLEPLMETYWHHLRVLEEQKQKYRSKSENETVDEFEALLTACTRERMISDVPLGAFLSGGIDSSAIVALMQKISPKPVKTYTIGFEESGYDEAAHARKVAAHLGTDHHEHYLTAKDAQDVIPLLPDIYDEPFGDFSQIPTYLVSKYARRSVSVILSGDGGDEMLGGYNRHVVGPRLWRMMKFTPRPARLALAKFITGTSIEKWNAMAPGQPRLGERMHKIGGILGLKTQEDIYNNLVSQWDNADATINGIDFYTLAADPGWHAANLSFAECMMYWDTLSYLPGDILTKVDRASMAVSLEARAPLLDKRIYDYVWTLPENMKIRNGQGKYLLRQVLNRHVPRALTERPKQGFSVPVAEWLRGDLRGWAEDLLDERALKEDGYLNAPALRAVWSEYLAGRTQHAPKIWTALMFLAWRERWL